MKKNAASMDRMVPAAQLDWNLTISMASLHKESGRHFKG